MVKSFKARAWIDCAKSALCINMLELFFDILWNKALSGPSIHACDLKDFAIFSTFLTYFVHLFMYRILAADFLSYLN